MAGHALRLRLVCSAGYYVRSLADALGERLGTGAHLAGLVRTRSGDFTLGGCRRARRRSTAGRRRPRRGSSRSPRLLPSLPAITLTPEGASLAARGGFIGPSHVAGQRAAAAGGRVRLLHPDGHLVAIAEPGGGRHAGLFAS